MALNLVNCPFSVLSYKFRESVCKPTAKRAHSSRGCKYKRNKGAFFWLEDSLFIRCFFCFLVLFIDFIEILESICVTVGVSDSNIKKCPFKRSIYTNRWNVEPSIFLDICVLGEVCWVNRQQGWLYWLIYGGTSRCRWNISIAIFCLAAGKVKIWKLSKFFTAASCSSSNIHFLGYLQFTRTLYDCSCWKRVCGHKPTRTYS